MPSLTVNFEMDGVDGKTVSLPVDFTEEEMARAGVPSDWDGNTTDRVVIEWLWAVHLASRDSYYTYETKEIGG